MADIGYPHQVPPVDPNDVHEQDQDYLETQLAQHARLKKLLPFLRPMDILDKNIRQCVETILAIEPKLGEDPFTVGDVADMVDSTCQLDEILSPAFSVELRSRFDCFD